MERQSYSSVLLPLAYLPPMDWFLALLHFDEIFIDTASPYRKQSYRNRCHILSANGTLALSIPIQYHGLRRPVAQVEIDYSKPWRRLHWRAIEAAYNRSPFFLYYRDKLEKRYTGILVPYLADWNIMLIEDILLMMNSSKKIVPYNGSFGALKSDILDLRTAFHPKTEHAFRAVSWEEYRQVFAEKYSFQNNLCILDALFNLGPETMDYINRASQK